MEMENVQQLIQDQQTTKKSNDMSDLFEVPKSTDNDMKIDHLLDTDGMEEDLSDLTAVSNEDIMGKETKTKQELAEESESIDDLPGMTANYNSPQNQRLQITPTGRSNIKRVQIPPTLGGMQ